MASTGVAPNLTSTGGDQSSPTHSATGYDSEKHGIQELENTAADINNAVILEFSPQEQRRIIRKVDFRLVTTLGVLYMASLTDRTNLSSANIAG